MQAQDEPAEKEKRGVKKGRDLLADQARDILAGREQWTPTWKTLGLDFTRPSLRQKAQIEKQESD